MNMKKHTNLTLPKAHNNSIPGKTKENPQKCVKGLKK